MWHRDILRSKSEHSGGTSGTVHTPLVHEVLVPAYSNVRKTGTLDINIQKTVERRLQWEQRSNVHPIMQPAGGLLQSQARLDIGHDRATVGRLNVSLQRSSIRPGMSVSQKRKKIPLKRGKWNVILAFWEDFLFNLRSHGWSVGGRCLVVSHYWWRPFPGGWGPVRQKHSHETNPETQ